MLQENKRDAVYVQYVRTSFDTSSDRHVLGVLLDAGVIALCCGVLCCELLFNNIHTRTY